MCVCVSHESSAPPPRIVISPNTDIRLNCIGYGDSAGLGYGPWRANEGGQRAGRNSLLNYPSLPLVVVVSASLLFTAFINVVG